MMPAAILAARQSQPLPGTRDGHAPALARMLAHDRRRAARLAAHSPAPKPHQRPAAWPAYPSAPTVTVAPLEA